jgi:hypothetical protein
MNDPQDAHKLTTAALGSGLALVVAVVYPALIAALSLAVAVGMLLLTVLRS